MLAETHLDPLIHEPARLTILTLLASCASADFVFLVNATGLTRGNLSSHLTKLEEAGLVKIKKSFRQKRPFTEIQISPKGRRQTAAHWQQLDKLRNTQLDPPQA